MARGLAARGAVVSFLTARAPGQPPPEQPGRDPLSGGAGGSPCTRSAGWLLAHRRSFDAVLDCQNGIPFFTPWVLPRRVPVLCVVHHVHTAQFRVHFPPWLAWAAGCWKGRRRGWPTGGTPASRSPRRP